MQEEVIRHYGSTLAYRMDLDAARSADPARVDAERRRFLRALRPLLEHEGPRLIVTDSQVRPPGVPLPAFWGGRCRCCRGTRAPATPGVRAPAHPERPSGACPYRRLAVPPGPRPQAVDMVHP